MRTDCHQPLADVSNWVKANVTDDDLEAEIKKKIKRSYRSYARLTGCEQKPNILNATDAEPY